MAAWNRNRLTSALGIAYPIVQGPFGGLQSQRLAAAVSNFGGLGSFGAMVIGLFGAAIATVGCAIAGPTTYLPWLLCAGAGCGMTGPGLFTFPQTLAGTQAVGRWYGWQNGFANLSGVVGPALTGFVLESTNNFRAPFAVAAAICIAGGLAWIFIVGRVEPIRWTTATVPRATAIASA
jgi:cyanate permease